MLLPQPTVPGWLSMPDEVDAQIAQWLRDFPGLVVDDPERQFRGRMVHAVTVAGPGPAADKRRMIVTVPHAHEPGATAGCMDFLNALLTGRHLDGRPADFDHAAALAGALVCVIPDANPGGRQRAPVRYWDGSLCPNEDFWCYMRGRDRHTGKMWKRLDLWDDRVETDHPDPIGIVYEQLNEHEYAEPNRTVRSSLLKLFDRLTARYQHHALVDVHQTEFEKNPWNAMVILPCVHDELPPERQAANVRLAGSIVNAWKQVGGLVCPDVRPLGYTGEQRAYFVRTWGQRYHRLAVCITEVQNNTPRTPPAQQMRLCSAALQGALLGLLGV